MEKEKKSEEREEKEKREKERIGTIDDLLKIFDSGEEDRILAKALKISPLAYHRDRFPLTDLVRQLVSLLLDHVDVTQ